MCDLPGNRRVVTAFDVPKSARWQPQRAVSPPRGAGDVRLADVKPTTPPSGALVDQPIRVDSERQNPLLRTSKSRVTRVPSNASTTTASKRRCNRLRCCAGLLSLGELRVGPTYRTHVRLLSLIMPNRTLTDFDLESLRRSLAMLQTNQLALTRDQGMNLIDQLVRSRAEIRRLRGTPDHSAQH